MREPALLHHLCLELSEHNIRLFRNSVGRLQDRTGRWIAYGVCNPGGSDLIGYRTIIVTPEMVGRRLAIFTAIEGKTGRATTTPEQANFISAVYQAGGIAVIARPGEDVLGKIDEQFRSAAAR